MKLAFVLFDYFPFGGLQRDCLAVAETCRDRGHAVTIYTRSWQGDSPAGIAVHLLPVSGWANHTRNQAFFHRVENALGASPVDCVIGFNKMPGLDVYYAADSCYAERTAGRPFYYFWTPRYRHYRAVEAEVFSPDSGCQILLINSDQQGIFSSFYGTEPERFHLLPPGVSSDRMRQPDYLEQRGAFRRHHQVDEQTSLLLFVGSDYKRKGLARAIRAVAALRERGAAIRLFVVGNGKIKKFQKLACELGVANSVSFFGARDDVTSFMAGADLLVHPAESENGGLVLIEALVAGLPVLATRICGFAYHIEHSGGGELVDAPFDQDSFNSQLKNLLDHERLAACSEKGLDYAMQQDLQGQHRRAAEVIEWVAVSNKNRIPETSLADEKSIRAANPAGL